MPPGLDLILMMGAMFALLYFLMIRPQKRRMQEHQQMQSQLVAGERVLLTSGVFGTIAHVGERQLIVELAPGVEVTVLKGNVAKLVGAEDEEFEFTDDDAEPSDESAAQVPDDASALTEPGAEDNRAEGK